MTTNAMSCELFNETLMAYLEHETDDATRTAIERHSVTCGDCGALLADLRKLRIDAANLPPMQPSRDLWAGIAARIEAPVVPIGRAQEVKRASSLTLRRWTRVSAIAASLVAAAGVGYMAANMRGQAAPVVVPPVASRPVLPDSAPPQVATVDSAAADNSAPEARTSAPVAPPTVVPVSGSLEAERAYRQMTADYDREITRLRSLIEQRRNQLDPATVAVIEKNLQVIDTAIADCKKAIVNDPSSRFLFESLNQSLQSKVELMRTAALLPSRT